jgi:hypothetical protein
MWTGPHWCDKRGLALWAIPKPPQDFLPATSQLLRFRKCDSVLCSPGKPFFNLFPSGVILKKEIGYLCPLVCILFLARFWHRYDVFGQCCGKQSVRWALKKVDHRWINIEKSSKWELHSLLHRIGCELRDKRVLDLLHFVNAWLSIFSLIARPISPHNSLES